MNNPENLLRCPRCSQTISFAAKNCAACGYAFPEEAYKKIFFYFDLKNDFKNLMAVESSVSERLLKLSQKIKNYELILSDDIKSYEQGLSGAEALSSQPAGAASEKEARMPVEAVEEKKLQNERPAQRSGTQNESPRTQPVQPLQETRKSAFETRGRMDDLKKAVDKKRSDFGYAPSGATTRNAAAQPQQEGDFEIMVGQKWMLIIGIITIVFGVGYFLKYSFERELIGPAGQVALSYLLGATFLGLGNFFHQKAAFVTFGLYMIGGAIAVFYFSAFAAFQLYTPPVIGQEFSFLIMILITVLASVLAIRFDVKWLAVLGLIGGFLTPVLVSSGRDNFLGLMSYMTLLNFGVLFVAFKKNWNLLNGLGFIGTYILYSGWYARYYADEKFWPALVFVNVFYLIYSVAPFAYQYLKNNTESSPASGFLIITFNAFIGFGYSYNMICEHFRASYYASVITVFYAAVFLAMASHLFKQGKRFADAFVVALGMASLFLIITIPMIFSNHWITFFWAAQAFVLLFMASKLGRSAVYAGSYILFAISLFKLFAIDYPAPGIFRLNTDMMSIEPHFTYLLAERYIAWIGVLAMFFTAAGTLRKLDVKLIVNDLRDSTIAYIIFGICLFAVLNIETAAFMFDYLPAARFAFISGLWACFAAALMVIGFKFNKYGVRKTSIALFLMTLIKVFLFDMGDMSTPWRILSFMVLGFIMVTVSFYYHKFKDKLMDAFKEEGRN
ncbi:MAG TPA: DUF2339 domain-containing protein [Candidatus Wallbacteria bacterium]|nr:MAG: hypothetical protein BWY32_03503 [bacterium ADurb.Bin243]HPG58494.1 DUF2339 domain-containing protein [Candidatus Wallbacteria bacterium]